MNSLPWNALQLLAETMPLPHSEAQQELTRPALCSFGVLTGAGLSTLIHNHRPHWRLVGIAGASIGAVWNYTTSSAIAWRGR